MNRRDFLKAALIGVGVTAVGGVIYQVVREYTVEDEAQVDRFVTVGAVDDFAPDSVELFTLPDTPHFFLVRGEDGGFLALSQKCTHQDCPVLWLASEQQYQCPCHQSAFTRNGALLGGPAPRPLNVHPIVIEDGQVTVNVGRTIKRDNASNQYVVYPA